MKKELKIKKFSSATIASLQVVHGGDATYSCYDTGYGYAMCQYCNDGACGAWRPTSYAKSPS